MNALSCGAFATSHIGIAHLQDSEPWIWMLWTAIYHGGCTFMSLYFAIMAQPNMYDARQLASSKSSRAAISDGSLSIS
jgi:hypothetical protein